MKNVEKTIRKDQKVNWHVFLARLPVAVLTLVFCGILILWDMGIIDLPFLKRTERREPLTHEDASEENKTLSSNGITEAIDWASFAVQQIDALYDYSFLDDGENLIVDQPYDPKTMSLVKIRLPQKQYKLSMGFLISSDGTLYWAKNLTPVLGSENYTLTEYQDSAGNPIFQNNENKQYYLLDYENSNWLPIIFDPETQGVASSFPFPSSYGAGQENTSLTELNGLFGYTGTYLENRRTKTFSVENVYTSAFAYSEGFAVMADQNGFVTIRNDRGEVVFENLSLHLTEKTGIDAAGFHYFDHGLLRVEFITFDETTNDLELREGVINTLGQEVSFPKGYFPVSYLDGVFVLSDGKNFGYYEANGAWLTSPIYTKAYPFFESVAVVENQEGKQGLIDRTGKEILAPTFDSISFSQDGLILVVDSAAGSHLLLRVAGNYMPGAEAQVPPTTSLHTKVTITRGPQNTFVDDEDSEILELPEVLTTTTRIPFAD